MLLLDQGEAIKRQPKVQSYDDRLWTGLAAIMDDTPGFKPVLSKDDMRLYEITALDE